MLRTASPPPPVKEAVDLLFHKHIDWFELMKIIRLVYDIGIFEAEKIALAHEGWRRWCDKQIISDPRCRKLAWGHMRHNGPNSLIEKDGDRLKVR
jgi:hypothetical protein